MRVRPPRWSRVTVGLPDSKSSKVVLKIRYPTVASTVTVTVYVAVDGLQIFLQKNRFGFFYSDLVKCLIAAKRGLLGELL